jgi:signal transduction histidine kinase
VEITLEDQGIGIPESEIGNLFSRFYRINNDTTRSVKGTGLGLYLSKYFIEAHRGELSVESRPGQGTKFLIRLPLELTQTEVVRPGLPLTGMRTLKNKEKSHA